MRFVWVMVLSFLLASSDRTRAAHPPPTRQKTESFDRDPQWANSKWCEVYLDDLSYTVSVEASGR